MTKFHFDKDVYMTKPSTPQTLPGISNEQIDAYLKAQRETVEEADRAWGRPNVGGLHTNTVREACRNGLMAALTAKPAPSSVTEIVSLMMPYVRACTRFCNTPRGKIDTAEVQAAFKPLEAALTSLVVKNHKLQFALDGVNAMREIAAPQPPAGQQDRGEKPVHGQLDPRSAIDQARKMIAYVQSFNGQKWSPVFDSTDRQNLAAALDNLEETAAMLLNMADRVAATASEATAAQQEPLSEAQRADLLTAAFYIAAKDDDSAVLRQEDAERIVDLLTELSGFDVDGIAAPANGEGA